MQRFRNTSGGCIDRGQPLRFVFDGKHYQGYAGDTLASALLANGVRLVGRSFKYHRPRGVVAAGAGEPNALITLRTGARAEPNLRATQIELFDGLKAKSQNRWPSLQFDVGGATGLMSRLFPAGFYYKTFMWPSSWWMFYERVIRRAAGLGPPTVLPDKDTYAKRFAHCDVLVVGGGPSGLMAALAAGRSGARVMLVDENPALGGRLLAERTTVADVPALDWVTQSAAELASLANVRVLSRSVAFGYYDQNMVAVAERVADHVAEPEAFSPRQRLWCVRAREVVLATGALERPLVFPGNDRPGVMLASAAQSYANQYAVRCGGRAVVFCNNDSAYGAGLDLAGAGVDVAAIVDARVGGPGPTWRERTAAAGIELLDGHVVVGTHGSRGLRAIEVMRYDHARGAGVGPERLIRCDLLCSSGGWNPTVHLFSQSQGRVEYDERLTSFVPGEARQAARPAGAVCGHFSLGECLAAGADAGADAAKSSGFKTSRVTVPAVAAPEPEASLLPLWAVPAPAGRHPKRFVDLQNDVTADDVALAVREGYQSVEHLKRYTTLGMGTDQGRTSNVNGLAILAATLDQPIPTVGTTTFRPPYTPVSLGTLAGPEIGQHFSPVRRTPMHDWHIAKGAPMVTAGLWMRPQYYARPGESMMDAINREAVTVRKGVGVVDVSTLGKIQVSGSDAAAFLEKVYLNRWQSLKVGRCRYGLMLREDGFLFDDGTTTRVRENEFYMTTTTAHAAEVMAHMEFLAQTVWPDMHVHLSSVTDQWGAMALAGPHSRDVLSAAVDDTDVSNEALAFMGYTEATIGGMPVRIFRITFSGELAYEIHMPAGFGMSVWEQVLESGKPWDIIPYGTEAMSVLRIEKGHVVGSELDGRTVPADFGFDRMQRPNSDFIGRRSLERTALGAKTRRTLVGLMASDRKTHIPRGAQLVVSGDAETTKPMVGHVTSTCYSPNLEAEIALALLMSAEGYRGQTLYAASPLTGQTVPVEVTDPVFIDPTGARARG